MMLYLMFVPALAFQLIIIAYLVRARRDDNVKFRFCDFQRETIAFLDTKEGKSLNDNDYAFVRWLLEKNAVTTSKFNIIKTGFNISYTLKNLRFFDHEVVTPAHRRPVIENQRVEELYHKFIDYTVEAFVAYTPFIKYKFLMRFCLTTAKLLATIGLKRCLLWTRELLDRWSTLRNENEYYCPV